MIQHTSYKYGYRYTCKLLTSARRATSFGFKPDRFRPLFFSSCWSSRTVKLFNVAVISASAIFKATLTAIVRWKMLVLLFFLVRYCLSISYTHILSNSFFLFPRRYANCQDVPIFDFGDVWSFCRGGAFPLRCGNMVDCGD